MATAGMPRATTATGSAAPTVERVLTLVTPQRAPLATQSVARFGDGHLVLHHGSIIQRYGSGVLLAEHQLEEGVLHHPNDCARDGDQLWVCDTGGDEPLLKLLDLASMRVEREIRPWFPGWRLASISLADEASQWWVFAEAVPIEERTRVLVARVDVEARTTLEQFEVLTDQFYVQGCSAADGRLYIGMNNGDVVMSKFLVVDIDSRRTVDTIVVDDFGESEGVDVRTVDGRVELTTATGPIVHRITW